MFMKLSPLSAGYYPIIFMCRIIMCSLLAIFLARATTQGCTIFVLTDGVRTLFFNNEN